MKVLLLFLLPLICDPSPESYRIEALMPNTCKDWKQVRALLHNSHIETACGHHYRHQSLVNELRKWLHCTLVCQALMAISVSQASVSQAINSNSVFRSRSFTSRTVIWSLFLTGFTYFNCMPNICKLYQRAHTWALTSEIKTTTTTTTTTTTVVSHQNENFSSKMRAAYTRSLPPS